MAACSRMEGKSVSENAWGGETRRQGTHPLSTLEVLDVERIAQPRFLGFGRIGVRLDGAFVHGSRELLVLRALDEDIVDEIDDVWIGDGGVFVVQLEGIVYAATGVSFVGEERQDLSSPGLKYD